MNHKPWQADISNHISNLSTDDSDLKILFRALSFAANKHKHQRRRDADASPYINHPISLAAILCNEAHVTDVETLCGALLHDTVEDTETTAEELEQAFGESICAIVMEVTDDKSLSKAERKQAQIDHAANISEKSKLVKLADKISNLRDVLHNPPPDWNLERRQQYFDWAQCVIEQVRGTHPTLEALFDETYAKRPEI